MIKIALTERSARVIAFYLPQFHPIPENDKWWGKGFTEWTNVTKAKPLFRGHHQPNIPADLGFYDLRVPETRIAQAKLAGEHGIEGFCYWHYWFSGKRLLERPFQEVLISGEPDYPFCIGWANQTWTGIWHGAPDRILMRQEYPGKDDYRAHFESLLKAFTDPRYIKVDEKPLFIVYSPNELPDAKLFTEYWQELAAKSDLKGLYFVGISHPDWRPEEYGFNALIPDTLPAVIPKLSPSNSGLIQKIFREKFKTKPKPRIYHYKELIDEYSKVLNNSNSHHYPCVIPNWDNTPRSHNYGVVFLGSTPELFRIHLNQAIKHVSLNEPDNRLVFIKSWNEWAEGNYLEPDQIYGKSYLKSCKEEILF